MASSIEWEVTIHVVSLNLLIDFHMICLTEASIPVVGSSWITIGGDPIKAKDIHSFLFYPPDNIEACESSEDLKSREDASFSIRENNIESPMPLILPKNSKWSRTERVGLKHYLGNKSQLCSASKCWPEIYKSPDDASI